ncbi:hypothetical protein LB557_04690 [Mesorhizobium sp. BR115XR7A]|uniref:hypothetical protein n=1 Tax=Mesorhizobium sp. BR115XR7A TaxID=2876645 RepID=UPI001CCC1DD1|nr:hypothetical protein [Mesorhizobium sp. BR115XR7A]MBZ9905307.1 hypothetical protein [Mesorhizobium sp. BR115XR7A]MBZ9930379.1 hypothetical protein [Mesorhizobium sp. BR1-1-5]
MRGIRLLICAQRRFLDPDSIGFGEQRFGRPVGEQDFAIRRHDLHALGDAVERLDIGTPGDLRTREAQSHARRSNQMRPDAAQPVEMFGLELAGCPGAPAGENDAHVPFVGQHDPDRVAHVAGPAEVVIELGALVDFARQEVPHRNQRAGAQPGDARQEHIGLVVILRVGEVRLRRHAHRTRFAAQCPCVLERQLGSGAFEEIRQRLENLRPAAGFDRRIVDLSDHAVEVVHACRFHRSLT